jgi:hypothetical protein
MDLFFFKSGMIHAKTFSRARLVFKFLGAQMFFYNAKSVFLAVNASKSWLIMLVAHYSETYNRYAFVLVICLPFQRQN